MKIEPYNFRKPSRLPAELEQQLNAWLTAGLAVVPEQWAKDLEVPITHALVGIETIRPIDAIAGLPDTVVGYRVAIESDEFRTLVAIPRPLMLTLAAGVLGEACKELSADRELTAVEVSLVEYLLQKFLGAIRESWPGSEPIAVTLKDAEPAPKRTRMFPSDDNVVCFSFSICGPFGEEPWHWLVPQKGLSNLFCRSADGPGTEQKSGVRAQLEALVGTMPLEVSVRLGGAVLHVSELAGLRSGDLVLLDQPVSRPLPVSVAGETRFLVWPGRVGEAGFSN